MTIELTEREQQVAELVKEGLKTYQIAEQLGISPRTVDTIRANIMRSMGIKGNLKKALQESKHD